MSQRIADSLEVLDLICGFARQNPDKPSRSWRKKAIAQVASRGVEKETVYAHLVGKSTAYTKNASDIDRLISAWITEGSADLKNWILQSCDKQDRERVNQFFFSEHSTPFASDIGEPEATERHLVKIYRILRDTALARRIKADNNYKCQICGERILLSKGNPYAETHHIKPLGSPHNGPDHTDNIACLCPNCHVKMDYGVIEINQKIFVNVHPEFIQYHNEVIRKKVE